MGFRVGIRVSQPRKPGIGKAKTEKCRRAAKTQEIQKKKTENLQESLKSLRKAGKPGIGKKKSEKRRKNYKNNKKSRKTWKKHQKSSKSSKKVGKRA